MPQKSQWAKKALFLSLIFLSLSNCQKEVALTFPNEVAGLKLVNLSQGKEALSQINKLHGKEIALKNGYVLNYQRKEERATIWISESKNVKEAEILLEQMVKGIKKGSRIFGHFREEKVGENLVYSVLGMGQKHFLYQKGDKVFWVAVNWDIAQKFSEKVQKEIR